MEIRLFTLQLFNCFGRLIWTIDNEKTSILMK